MDIRKVFQDVVAPELRAIEGKFEAVNVKLDALNMRIDGLDKRIDGLDKRIDGLEKRIEDIRDEFHLAISLQERIAVIEAKLSVH